MSEKRLHTEWNTFTLVSLGALVAIQLILTRFLAINIGGYGRDLVRTSGRCADRLHS